LGSPAEAHDLRIAKDLRHRVEISDVEVPQDHALADGVHHASSFPD
jgi:hypothetical protein